MEIGTSLMEEDHSMVTNRSKTKSTRKRPTAEERARARLNNSPQARQLLALYGLTLSDESLENPTVPLFGGEVVFPLSFYNGKHERVALQTAPTLTRLAQHLGLVSEVDYEEVRNSSLPKRLQEALYDTVIERGKKEMQRILRDARPLLLQQEIYFYCLPITCLGTIEENGDIRREPGDRPLGALPLSVQVAQQHGYTKDQIRALAPQNAWLIPMLIVYRQLKDTKKLRIALDGWLKLLTPQQRENLYIKFVKYAPHIVDQSIIALLRSEPLLELDEPSD
jgi:hypothetical protein